MYSPQNISKNIKVKAKEISVSTGKMLSDCGFNKNALATMNAGHMPELEKLCIIADYLNCSLDYLVGRTIKNNAPDSIRSAIISKVNLLPDDRLDRLLGYLEALAAE